MIRREVAELEAFAARSEEGAAAKLFRLRKLSSFESGDLQGGCAQINMNNR